MNHIQITDITTCQVCIFLQSEYHVVSFCLLCINLSVLQPSHLSFEFIYLLYCTYAKVTSNQNDVLITEKHKMNSNELRTYYTGAFCVVIGCNRVACQWPNLAGYSLGRQLLNVCWTTSYRICNVCSCIVMRALSYLVLYIINICMHCQ